MRKLLLILVLILVLAIAACGGESAPSGGSAGGDAAAGKKVFGEVAAPPCGTCHSTNPGEMLVGPSLAGIGVSGEESLRQSIVEPNVVVAEGFSGNIMPATYGAQLSEQQLADLVAYLLSLK